MIKRLHSTLFYASDLRVTADFYRKIGFDVQESEDDARIKMGDFTLAFIDEKKTPIQNESGKTPKGLGIYTYVEVDDVDAGIVVELISDKMRSDESRAAGNHDAFHCFLPRM